MGLVKSGILVLFAFLIALMFSAGTASAEILKERTFQESGINAFEVKGAAIEECRSFNFLFEQEFNRQGVFPVLVLEAKFEPPLNVLPKFNAASIKVFLNNEIKELREIKTRHFFNNIASVMLPRERLERQNTIKVCLKTSDGITGIKITENSKIGYYKLGFIEEESFEKTVETTEPIIGQEVKVRVRIKNPGSESLKVETSFRKEDLDIVQIIKGDSDFSGFIKEGEEKILEYFVKLKIAGQVSLVPATLKFENIFGEIVELRSKQPTIIVKEPEFNVKGFLAAGQKINKPLEQARVELVLSNEGLNDLQGVSVMLEGSSSLVFERQKIAGIGLKAGEDKTLQFNVSSAVEGRFELGCEISLGDFNSAAVRTRCESIELEFEKETVNSMLVFAVVLLVVGGIIYAFVFSPLPSKIKFS